MATGLTERSCGLAQMNTQRLSLANECINLTVRPVSRLARLPLVRPRKGTRKARGRLGPQVTAGVRRLNEGKR